MIKLQCNAIFLEHDDKFVCFVTVFSVWIIFILQLKDEIRMWSCCKSLFTGMLPYTFMNYGLYISVNPVLIWLCRLLEFLNKYDSHMSRYAFYNLSKSDLVISAVTRIHLNWE